jgi:hypothetical protein
MDSDFDHVRFLHKNSAAAAKIIHIDVPFATRLKNEGIIEDEEVLTVRYSLFIY